MLAKIQNPKILMPTILILLLIGISIGFIFGLISSASTPERYIALDSGGAIIAGDQGNVWGQAGTGKQTLETLLPTTLLEAKNSGWIERSSCIANKGKYLTQKDSQYLLIFNIQDELIGIYLVSQSEKQSPWIKSESLSVGSQNILDYPHWNLVVNLKNPSNACDPV
tara:strand:+ start:992 stop:1492 length:501 start_codon:yes stop_codon:yes gene_type:complete